MSWEKSIAFVMAREGGYVNDVNDPGGETNFGITKASYPNLDIKNLTPDMAKSIYFTDYWLKSGAQTLVTGLDLMHFDCAVNEGLGVARQILAISRGDVAEYATQRIMRYVANPQFERYGLGWIRRVTAALKAAEDK